MGRLRNVFAGWVVLPLFTLGASAALTGGWPFVAGGQAGFPVGLPDVWVSPEPRVADEAELVKVARDVCPQFVSAATCKQVPVVVEGLSGNEAGEARSTSTWRTEGGVTRSSVVPTKVVLDPKLVGEDVTYVRYIAAHEWSHVKQVVLSQTPERYDRLTRDAATFFQPRATTPLEGTTGGLELLTDCMAIDGGFEQGTRRGRVTAYGRMFTGAATMDQACVAGWKKLLPSR